MAQDIFIRFKGDASGLQSTVNRVNQSLRGLQSNADRASQGINGIERSARNTTGAMSRLTGAATAFIGALGIREILQFGDSVQNIQNRLALIDPSLGSVADNFERVRSIANKTFQPLNSVADLYQKVARSADEYNLSAEQVGTVTTTFTNLLRLAGADAGTAAGAITQFAQALGSGVLRGDELNSVIEATAGEILPILANELGVSTGQVRQLAQEGKITGDVLVRALGNAADNVGDRVGNMSVTIGGAITVLKNNLLALGTESTPVFNGIAQAILLLANNLERAASYAVAATSVFVGYRIAVMAAAVANAGLTASLIVLRGALIRTGIGALVVLIGEAIYQFDRWKDTISDFTSNFMGLGDIAIQLGEVNTTVGEVINAVWLRLTTKIPEYWNNAVQFVLTTAGQLGTFISDVWGNVSESVRSAANSIGGMFGPTFTHIMEIAKNTINNIVSTFYFLYLSVGKIIRNIPDIFVQVFRSIGTLIGDFVSRSINQFKNIGTALYTAITAPFTDATFYEALQQLTTNAFAGFGDSVRAEVSAIQNVLPDFADEIETAFEFRAVDEAGAKLTEWRNIAMEALIGARDATVEELGQMVLEYRNFQDAQAAAAEAAAAANAEIGESAGTAANNVARLTEEAQKLVDAFRATATDVDQIRAGIGAFERLNPLDGVEREYRNSLAGLERLRDLDRINEAEYLKTKARLHENYSREVAGIQRDSAVESLRIAGVTNQSIISVYEQTFASMQQAQRGGLTGMIGFTDAMSTVFNQLGQQSERAFNAAKAFNIASAIMNTALAATKAFAQGGVLGFVTAAAVIAAGMAQVSAIRAQTYSGRALGGPVMGGESYIVGENGPELFTPATSGSITRNDQLMGGQPVEITFNINAIDSQGIDQVLVARQSVIRQLISDAMLEAGQRSRF